MTEITTSKGTFLFVPVPEDDIIVYSNIDWYVACSHSSPGLISLADGNEYKFISTTDKITEEQAAGIVDDRFGAILLNHIGYADYISVNQDYNFHHTAISSFHSLLQKHSLTGRQAILKKI